VKYIATVSDTGITRTRYCLRRVSASCLSFILIYQFPRYVHRLVPVSGTCVANLPEIEALCRDVFKKFFDKHSETSLTVSRKCKSSLPCIETCPQYKIELRVRNHTTIPRLTLIQNVAQCMPEGHTVDLENPRIFILVEVFKVCLQYRMLSHWSDEFYTEYLWCFSRRGLLQIAEVQCHGDR